MERTACPSCGATYSGRRCRSCGYEPFPEADRQKNVPAAPVRRKKKHTYPLIRFLLLLYLLYALIPLLRNWGLKLEAMEDMARKPESSYHSQSNSND